MKSVEFLFEYRRDVTAQKLGDKLLASAKRENITDIDKILATLEDMDPTPNKQYTLWIANQYNKGQFRLEDKPRIKTALERFMQAKSRLPEKDIGRYDFYQLENAMEKIFNPDVGKPEPQTVDTFEIPNEIKDEVEVLYNGPLGLLVVPKTKKASCVLGSGTRWCTAGREDNMFSTYNRRGPLYIWRDKNGEKYQFHFSSNQYMDKQDRPIPNKLMSYFSNKHPVLKKLFDLRLKYIFEKKRPMYTIIEFVKNTQKILPKELEDIILKNPERALIYYSYVKKDRWPKLEKIILDKSNVKLAFRYAKNMSSKVAGRFLKGESLIAKYGGWALEYATSVIGGRFPEGEKEIAKDPFFAYEYARSVIGGRFPEGEKALVENPYLAIEYAQNVIKGRFLEAEDNIANDANTSIRYVDAIRRRFPKGEKLFAKNAELAIKYALLGLKGRRFEQGENVIAKDPRVAYFYAKGVVKGRWPEGEKAIATDPDYAYRYARDVIDGRWPEGEKAIAKDAKSAFHYALHVIEGRFPKGEKAIANTIGFKNDYKNFLARLKRKKKSSKSKNEVSRIYK